MPRYPRLFLPDIPVHIVQRGHDRQPVFIDPDDYRYYLSNIVEAKERLEIRVHAYCLMTNHVHLLLSPRSKADSVSALMRVLAGRQTRYTNKRESRTGTLWEGRFKASLVDSDAYLLACCRYIELNPVHAGIVTEPDQYVWSSYRHNAGMEKVDWLDSHPNLSWLGSGEIEQGTAYREFVGAGVDGQEREIITTALNRNQATGNNKFREAIRQRTGRRLSAAPPGRPARGQM